jgi:uncharacterized membrane protein YqaE (UPF0057 family)
MTSMKLLHVVALRHHPQGVFYNKGMYRSNMLIQVLIALTRIIKILKYIKLTSIKV